MYDHDVGNYCLTLIKILELTSTFLLLTKFSYNL